MAKTLYLIDGHAQFFRAYHAIRSGMSSPVTKEPTNMTFGFVGMLLKVLREYTPDYLAVVIDVSGDRETFRSTLYPDYKATRKPAPEDLHVQVERCLSIMEQMCIPVIGIAGVEADDVIATIVRRLQREQPDLQIRIVSKDKDLTQLLNHNVELFDVHKDQAVTAAETFDTPGLEPKHVIDVLTLMGDSIDNVPGVAGVGPKTAGQLILQYGSLDNLLAHLGEIKGKRRENLEAARDKLPLSKQLVTLKDDVEVDFDLSDAQATCERLPVDALLATFRELGFNRFQDELTALVSGGESNQPRARDREPPSLDRAVHMRPRRSAGATDATFEDGLFSHMETQPSVAAASSLGDYRCIRTKEELKAFVDQIRERGCCAIDTETTGLSPINDQLCGISISLGPATGVYIATKSCEQESHMDAAAVIEILRPVLEDPSIKKIGHNLKFDINVLRNHGVRLAGQTFDTMVASYVIDATRSSHAMDVLALALLNHTCIPITDLIGKGKHQRTFDQAPLDLATNYSAMDADVTYRLHDCMAPQIEAMGFTSLFHEVEMPLVNVLAELEWNGIKVDAGELDRQRIELEKRVAHLKRQLQEQAPFPFNPDSPKQLAAVLFNKPAADPPGLGLRPLRRGKTGPSTDQEVLDRLAGDPTIDSPIPRLIVEYRQLTKLVNTYLTSLKEAINPRTNRIHASFNQTVAVTGRLSSSDPNLQNIPIRTDIGREIRRAFVAEDSHENWLNQSTPHSALRTPHSTEANVLITADYSQIELRLLAHLADDPVLISAFEQGLDIHTAVAVQVYGVKPDEVSIAQRTCAKMVNFGIVYGVTPGGLARRLSLAGAPTTQPQAAAIIADYKSRYRKVAEFLEACIHTALRQGYVETILKRRRPITQITSRDPQTRALGERLAINSVVQGSAADLIKIAMIDIHQQLEDAREIATQKPMACTPWACVRMVLQIHDELVFEAPESHAEAVAAFVRDRMQNAMKLKVPLVVDAAWSKNWIDGK